jgi:2-enoate reductase
MLVPLKQKKSLLVVGGGPAGIEAARVGVQRGFDVTLWEASDRLGGNLWPAAKPDFKRDIADYLTYLQRLAGRLPINVVLNRRATAGDIQSFGADYVILATGAEMEPPPIDGNTVLSTIQLLNGMEARGEKILVMGAGVIGCETALYLARRGKQVTLCARQDAAELDTDILDIHNREMLFRMLRDEKNITVLRGTIPLRLDGDGVVADQQGAEKRIPMDSLVFAGRLFSQNALSASFEKTPHVLSIGDCTEPGTIMQAVWGGFNTVREIEN